MYLKKRANVSMWIPDILFSLSRPNKSQLGRALDPCQIFLTSIDHAPKTATPPGHRYIFPSVIRNPTWSEWYTATLGGTGTFWMGTFKNMKRLRGSKIVNVQQKIGYFIIDNNVNNQQLDHFKQMRNWCWHQILVGKNQRLNFRI